MWVSLVGLEKVIGEYSGKFFWFFAETSHFKYTKLSDRDTSRLSRLRLSRLRLSCLRLSCSRLTCSRLSRSRILRSRHSGLSYSHLFEECCVFPHCVNRMHSCRMRKRDERGNADAKDETRTRKTQCGRVSPALLNSRNNDSNANFFIRINLE